MCAPEREHHNKRSPRSCDNPAQALFPKRAVVIRARAHDPQHGATHARVYTLPTALGKDIAVSRDECTTPWPPKKLMLRELRDRRERDKEEGFRRRALEQLPARTSSSPCPWAPNRGSFVAGHPSALRAAHGPQVWRAGSRRDLSRLTSDLSEDFEKVRNFPLG